MHEFDAKMEQLRAEYRALVSSDLQKLQQQASLLSGNVRDRPELERMEHELHRIAGGAGVFGFARLSEQARGLELDLADWLEAGLGDAYQAALPEFRAALAGLLRAVT